MPALFTKGNTSTATPGEGFQFDLKKKLKKGYFRAEKQPDLVTRLAHPLMGVATPRWRGGGFQSLRTKKSSKSFFYSRINHQAATVTAQGYIHRLIKQT